MAKLLFLTWYGAGNQVPTIGLARQLADRGHDVVVAGYADQRATFASQGLDFATLPRADATYADARTQHEVLAAVALGVWACRDHLEDVPELVAATGCDAVLVDCLMLAALAALEDADVPVGVVVHSAPGALAPPGGEFDSQILGLLDEVRNAAGLQPVGQVWDAWAPFTTLCTSIAELDPLAPKVPPSFAFVGPVFDPPGVSGWEPPWSADDPRPLAVVSFSTGPAWDQRSRIERTLAALDGDRYRVLALTGTADTTGLAVPANATSAPYVPHAEVLPGAAVTVTHAGHGTVCASLAHGVPMVCLPNPAADQPALAAQVVELGAGVALDGEVASPAEIAGAVDAVVAEPRYATAAATLGDRIAGSPGAVGAATLVEQMVGA